MLLAKLQTLFIFQLYVATNVPFPSQDPLQDSILHLLSRHLVSSNVGKFCSLSLTFRTSRYLRRAPGNDLVECLFASVRCFFKNKLRSYIFSKNTRGENMSTGLITCDVNLELLPLLLHCSDYFSLCSEYFVGNSSLLGKIRKITCLSLN